jgi:hypothetical protein
MPFYSYHCKRCDSVQDGYRSISSRHDSPDCCGEPTQLCIAPPAVQPDVPGYHSPVTGRWIEGKSARREDLRQNRCTEYDPEMKKDAARTKREIEAKQERKLEEAAARAYYSLPPDKQRILRRGY